MSESLSEQDWRIRLYIYHSFVEHGCPPAYDEVARQFQITAAEARAAYHRLHDHHMIFLEPGSDTIRMANPLSAVPTAYRVQQVDGRAYWANCAWDSLGIPAMLDADAMVEATLTDTGAAVTYAITAGTLQADPLVVHFSLPVARWYDDLVHT